MSLGTMLRRQPLRVLLLCVLCVLLVCDDNYVVVGAMALRVRPTMSSIILDVGDEELCMYSTGKDFYEGAAMHFRVIDGDDDFDVIVRNYDNRTIYASYAGEHELQGSVYFTTHSKHEHAFCIDNRRYSKARKRVQMSVGTTSLTRWKSRFDPLQKLMKRSQSMFLGMSDDQMMLRLREQTLRSELEKTRRLVTYRSVAEMLVIVFVTLINVILAAWLLRRSGKRSILQQQQHAAARKIAE